MKKIIMKVGLIIMALTTMVTMNACSKINNETANDVCTALSEKYGESFVAVKIGDRFNTNSAKLYVHPADNELVLFTATIDKDTGVVEDNYVEEKVCSQVEKIVKTTFDKAGISADSRCMVVTKNPLTVENSEYTPASFQEAYDFNHYTLYLVLQSGEYAAADILNCIKAANEAIGVKLVVTGYIFDEEMFAECISDIQAIPDMSVTMIEANSPKASFDVNVDQGACSISESELSERIGRS